MSGLQTQPLVPMSPVQALCRDRSCPHIARVHHFPMECVLNGWGTLGLWGAPTSYHLLGERDLIRVSTSPTFQSHPETPPVPKAPSCPFHLMSDLVVCRGDPNHHTRHTMQNHGQILEVKDPCSQLKACLVPVSSRQMGTGRRGTRGLAPYLGL